MPNYLGNSAGCRVKQLCRGPVPGACAPLPVLPFRGRCASGEWDGGSGRAASERLAPWLCLKIPPAGFSYFPEHLLKIIFCNVTT